jgi:RHS Repeat.
MNLAVLLQTLDEDGNPDNGIKISAAVAGLFAGVSFNFEQSVETFQRDPAFRSILNQANTQALLSDQRAIKNPRYAIAHLYNTLDINPQLYAAIRFEEDTDADGTTDRIKTYQYDIYGNCTRQEEDSDANGIADYLGTYTYDAQGNLTRYEEVYDANSTTGRIIDTLQYDAQGNLTRVEYDANADGTVDAIKHYTYAPSGWGNLGMRMNPEIHRATRAEEY